MRIKKLLYLALAVTVLPFSQACEKTEGEGGKATLTGKVTVQKRERIQNTIIAEYEARGERVYIVYGGDSEIHDDDVRTSYNGQYKFKYLYPGTYKVFAYSECQSCPEGENAFIVEVEVGKDQTEVVAPDIFINEY